MSNMYVAVVKTDASIYRATAPNPRLITITEDGVDGVRDFIHLEEDQVSASSPENLAVTLTWWVFEYARGEEIRTATLTIKN